MYFLVKYGISSLDCSHSSCICAQSVTKAMDPY